MVQYNYETDDETGIYIEDDPNFVEDEVNNHDDEEAPSPPCNGMLLVLHPNGKQIEDDTMSEMMDSYILPMQSSSAIIPQEDPIVSISRIDNTNMKTEKMIQSKKKMSLFPLNIMKVTNSNNETLVVDHDYEEGEGTNDGSGLTFRKFLLKWGMCYLVLFVVIGAICGMVFMFRNSMSSGSSSSSSSSNSNTSPTTSTVTVTLSPSTSIPTSVPSMIPTTTPSMTPSVAKAVVEEGGPTKIPITNIPTMVPTSSVPTNVPTTATPSYTPSSDQYQQIISILRSASTTPEQFNHIMKSDESIAANWVKYNSTIVLSSNEKIIQRYTMALLDFALHNNFTLAVPSIDECEWLGVSCDTTTGMITKIQWNDVPITTTTTNDMKSEIPHDIALLSNSLTYLDLSNNNIVGTIPMGLYDCTQLQHIYLHSNQLTGTINKDVAQLSNVQKLFISSNSITGSIPTELSIPSLEWLSLYNNQLTGSIPSNMDWSNMIYLDLGKNQLTGTIPIEWVDVMIDLNALYLDWNQINGTIPTAFTSLGNNTIELIKVNNNLLSGEITSVRNGMLPNYNLTTYDIYNNDITRIDKEFCKDQSIYEVGNNAMLSIFTTDCDICTCNELCSITCIGS